LRPLRTFIDVDVNDGDAEWVWEKAEPATESDAHAAVIGHCISYGSEGSRDDPSSGAGPRDGPASPMTRTGRTRDGRDSWLIQPDPIRTWAVCEAAHTDQAQQRVV
jgi:hypothetical protein